MIYVLQGEDDFSKKQFLENLREGIGTPDLLEANTNTLAGAGLTLAHLEAVCNAVPFLAERRLVIVEGLLGQFDNMRADRPRRRPSSGKDALEAWEGLIESLNQTPPTTLLVFMEGRLRRDNPILKQVASAAQVQEFPVPRGERLESWIRQRVDDAGAKITPQAVRRLADLVGGDLWILSGEIEKLALYAGEDAIDEEAVESLVVHAREASIFKAVDTILDGRSSVAIELVNLLRLNGAEVSYIITMLARQLRLILLTQELRAQRLPRSELGRRLGLTVDFAIRQTEEHARRHDPERVTAMYRRLLETDLAIKTGELSEDLALETLVVELSGGPGHRISSPSRS